MRASKPGSAALAATIKRSIMGGEMIAGDRLPAERVLAERYGISRGTVRAALAALEESGFVETRLGSGTYVIWRKPNDTSMPLENARPLELMDARFALEPHICRLAVLQATQEDFVELEELLGSMEASVDDAVAFSDADSAWHSRLAASTGNRLLTSILSQINSVRGFDEWTRMRNLTLDRPTIERYNIQHRAIVNAIRARDPDRAAALMKEHLETARMTLVRIATT